MKKIIQSFPGLEIPGNTVFAWAVFYVIIIFISIYNHLIAHILLGGYSIALVYILFIYSSRTYRFKGKNYIVNLASALLLIALLDLFHVFTFRGMALIDFYGSNIPLQFWVSARVLESGAFLFFMLSPAKSFNLNITRFVLAVMVLGISASVIIFKNFPLCYVDNYGATDFKYWSQLFVILFMLFSLYLLIKKRGEFESLFCRSLVAAILASIACETIIFLFDENIFLAGASGHFLKALSYYLLCHGVYVTGISMPVERFIESEQLIKFERGKILKLFNSINCGLCSIDIESGSMRLTGKWFNNLGYKGEESADSLDSWDKIIYPEDRHFIEYLKSGENRVIDYEFRMKSSSGEYEWVSLRGIVTESGFTGKEREIFCVILLISDRKKFEFEIMDQKRKIEESDRLKSAFIDNLGHEIRTPLDSILGFSRMLREKGKDAGKSGLYIDIIESSSRQILSVVSDLIDIARIDEGQFQLNYDKIDLNNLIDEMEELYKVRLKTANKEHIGFHVIKGAPGDCGVISDMSRLKQILYNLLNNSIKFTHAGEITLSYEICRDTVTFRVNDTGIGIDDNKKEIIFERFRQGDEGVSRTYGGIGLGLPIVRELVNLMGGTLGFDSEPGRGSEFYFTIPRNIKSGAAL
jgi:signal transduction histidine kinase